MSTTYNIYVIYGFLADSPVSRERKTGRVTYLTDWLAENEFPEEVEQHNAGVSNGGSPSFFVGVKLHEIRNFTRVRAAYTNLPTHLEVKPELRDELMRARDLLRQLDPELVGSDLGFYLIGDAA